MCLRTEFCSEYAFLLPALFFLFFFNDTATTEIYTLSLHDALPISSQPEDPHAQPTQLAHRLGQVGERRFGPVSRRLRSEEHTSELQSPCNLVCRLLLEKKKKNWLLTSLAKRTQTRRTQTPHPPTWT